MSKNNYFFNPLKAALAAAIILGLTALIMSYSDAAPVGRTGAPGESSCVACHNTANSGFDGMIQLEGLPSEIIANETYNLTLKTISTATRPVRGGFSFVALNNANNSAGAISTVGYSGLSYATDNGREYVGHAGAQLFGSSDTLSWSFDWTAPANTDTINFYAASVLANGIGGTDGDTAVLYTATYAITTPPAMEVTIDNVSEPTCYNYTNGVAHATVTNGVQPFKYQWTTGDTLAWVYTMGAGVYGVTVTDAHSNIATADITIGQPEQLIAEVTAPVTTIPCGENVELTVTASGGTGAYTYSWNADTTATGDSLFVNQGGYYCVQVTDENHCAAAACIGINGDPNGVFCNGISADTITCNYPSRTLIPGVTSNDTISYSWTGPNGFTSTDTFPAVTQGGEYTLVATIPSGCSCTSTVNVVEATSLEINVIGTTPTTCAYSSDGAIAANIVTGAFEPITSDPVINPDSLAAGDYTVTVTNGVGCTTVVEFTIESPDSIFVTLDSITPIVGTNPGAIQITTTGGTPNYGWAWINGADTTVLANIPNGSLTGITIAGNYMLYVFDSNSCIYLYGPYTVPLIDAIQDLTLARSISLAPNPASDFFTITKDDLTQQNPLDVLVYGLNNQLVQSHQFSERSNTVDVHTLPAGLYHIVFQSGDKIAVKQLIIKR